MRYITRVLIGLDQFANTIIGGYPDETISARSGRLKSKPTWSSVLWWRPLAFFLNRVDPDHIEKAVLSEETGSQQDPAYDEVYDPDDEVVIKVKDQF
jgi:hypothetical protein